MKVNHTARNKIRAQLTINGHEDMSNEELKSFKKWILAIAESMQIHKRGELSKVFRAKLYNTEHGRKSTSKTKKKTD